MSKKRKPKWGSVYIRSKQGDDKKFPLARCKECPMRYWAVEKDAKTEEVLREISCKDKCEYYRLSGRKK